MMVFLKMFLVVSTNILIADEIKGEQCPTLKNFNKNRLHFQDTA